MSSISTDARPSSLEPVAEAGRIEMLDVVRGVALLGILLVNLETFAFPAAAFGDVPVLEAATGRSSGADRLTFRLIDIFCEMKFVTIFSIWFGISLQLLAQRSLARGVSPEPLLARRMVALALIGGLHGAFFWYGDILLPYAMVGAVAVVTLRARPSTLLVLAAGALGLTLAISLLAGLMIQSESEAWREQQVQQAAEEVIVYSSGTIEEIRSSNRSTWIQFLIVQVFLFMPRLLADLWIGMAIVKLGLLLDERRRRRVLLWLARVALPLGILLEVARSVLMGGPVGGESSGSESALTPEALELSVHMMTSLVLALGYIGVLGLWVGSARLSRLRLGFARIGRTALSSYLGQTLLCTALFYSWGLGLFASLPAALLPLVAACVIGIEMVAARAWLSRFRFGPVEWIWRLVTYGHWVPIHRALAAEGVEEPIPMADAGENAPEVDAPSPPAAG